MGDLINLQDIYTLLYRHFNGFGKLLIILSVLMFFFWLFMGLDGWLAIFIQIIFALLYVPLVLLVQEIGLKLNVYIHLKTW